MPQQITTATENNFTKGLITEATGLNFPENAATETDNCIYSLVGDVYRRPGFDFEPFWENFAFDRTQCAMTSYVWNNPGGESNKRLMVRQIGAQLVIYEIDQVTNSAPLSFWNLGSNPNISGFVVSGKIFDYTVENQYAEGNGYLFIYNSNCDPLYLTYTAGTVTVNPIFLKIRDFVGVVDNLQPNTRPATLTADHQYNLQNQGWTSGGTWAASSNTSNHDNGVGTYSWNVGSGITGITVGQTVQANGNTAGSPNFCILYGTVTSYTGGILTLAVYTSYGNSPGPYNVWTFSPQNIGFINTFQTAEAAYPSNSDVWWYFKDSTGAFDPATTASNVTLGIGAAPQGHYVLSAFDFNRSSASGISGLTEVSTTQRPTTGCWFQGRVWYTGVSDSFVATGDANFYTWSNNIYFSTVVETPADFSVCYQTNDPTSENLFDEIATDGGVITIAECGTIHKLFPIANGLLVFANNGVWFITGSQGIGFSPTDYTVTKISSVKVLSNKSFVEVMGMPMFWNEDGIYQVSQQQNGSLAVEPITVGTILTFYQDIPVQSMKYARGDYDPVNYMIYWLYKSTQEVDVTTRYQYDSILVYNTYNKAFYTYSFTAAPDAQFIHSVNYINFPVIGANTPEPGFWFSSSYNPNSVAGNYQHQFTKEFDTNYVDWGQTTPVNYQSYFVTGYKIRGQGIRKFQPQYIQVFSRTNNAPFAYYIQGLWDYANNRNSGRWGTNQYVENTSVLQDVVFRRHRIRGHGYTLQFKITSVDQQPFDIIGWSVIDTVNAGA